MQTPEAPQSPARNKDSTWPLQYMMFGFLGAHIAHAYTPTLLSVFNADKAVVTAASHIGAFGLTYLAFNGVTAKEALRDTKPLRFLKHTATKVVLAGSFALAAGHLMEKNTAYEAAYKAERAAMPRIDAKTVIGTKPVTIADQYCQNKSRGAEITIEHQGQKMLTVCPR